MAPYAGPGSILSDPYSQDIASSSTSVKKESKESKASSLERPKQARDFGDTDEDEEPPRKKARRKAVVACDFCKSVFGKIFSLCDHPRKTNWTFSYF
jgi:hypothetical protein